MDFDARFERVPIHGDRLIDLNITATLFRKQLERVIRQDAAIPQRAFVRAVTATFFGELGRSEVGVITDCFHRAIRKLHRILRRVRRAHHVQRILKTHDAEAHRAMLQVRSACFFDGVVINVNDVVEHAHRGTNRLLQLDLIEHVAAIDFSHMIDQVH